MFFFSFAAAAAVQYYICVFGAHWFLTLFPMHLIVVRACVCGDALLFIVAVEAVTEHSIT